MYKNAIIGMCVVAAGTATMAADAADPNWRAKPTYTTVNLSAGFTPDPWSQRLRAGGGNRVPRRLGSGCTGYINNAAPDVDLNYQASSGFQSLYIRVDAGVDTTLVIMDPAGNWHCNDDAIGLNPMVRFDSPRSGNYNIWVGTHGSSDLAPAELLITELDPRHAGSNGTSAHDDRPNWRAAPTYETVDLSSGFVPDPWKRRLRAGGSHDVSASVAGRCVGYVNGAAPDVDLNYTAGSMSLYFHAVSDADTTLVVLDPAGNWHCNDDAVGLDPVVSFGSPRSGNYNIWVGVHGSARMEPAELRISEFDPR